jgi:hypothetical protein
MITAKQSVHFAQLLQQFDNKQMQSYYEHLLSDEPVEDFFLKFAKYNPNHDARGRFTTGGGSGAGAGAPAGAGAGIVPPAPGSGDYLTADEATLTEGTFDEETQADELAATYEERYNVTEGGLPIGTTYEEQMVVNHYAGNGYKEINSTLRGQDIKTELDYDEARDIVNNDPKLYEQAISEYEAGHVGPLGDADYEDAIYQFATSGEHGKEILSIYNSGTSPKRLAVQADVARLDSVIASAPVVFGDKPLYRVFDDKVISRLKPGDVVTDKGFLSTTRTNILDEKNSQTRTWLGGIDKNNDTAGIIMPNKGKNGKGLSVDAFKTALNDSSPVSADEKEVLLPRGVPLLFLGYADIGVEDRAPVFQRMDG